MAAQHLQLLRMLQAVTIGNAASTSSNFAAVSAVNIGTRPAHALPSISLDGALRMVSAQRGELGAD